MSYYNIPESDKKVFFTSFDNSETFYEYFRNLINNEECMGVYCLVEFFFENYTKDKAIQFKNNIVRKYMTENTEEFFNLVSQYNHNNSEFDCYNLFVYFSDYALMIKSDFSVYKVSLGEPNRPVISGKHTSYESREHQGVTDTHNFKATYSFDEMDELKKNVVECVDDKKCVDIFINDHHMFCSVSQRLVDHIHTIVVPKYISENIDDIFNNTSLKTMHLYMRTETSVYSCNCVIITMNKDNINVNVVRKCCY